jgi:hypothetical protein
MRMQICGKGLMLSIGGGQLSSRASRTHREQRAATSLQLIIPIMIPKELYGVRFQTRYSTVSADAMLWEKVGLES